MSLTHNQIEDTLAYLKENREADFNNIIDQLKPFQKELNVLKGECVGMQIVPGTTLTPEEHQSIEFEDLEEDHPEKLLSELRENERQLTESLETLKSFDHFRDCPSLESLNEETKTFIQRNLDIYCQKVGLESLEPSLENINNVASKIYDAFLEILSKITETFIKINKWLSVKMIRNKKLVAETKAKSKENLKYMLDRPELKVQLNMTQVKWFTPPHGKQIDIEESVSGWINVIRELNAYRTNERNAQTLINNPFDGTYQEQNQIAFKIQVELPFKNYTQGNSDTEYDTIDYFGPKLSGGFQLAAIMPNLKVVSPQLDYHRFLRSLSRIRFTLSHEDKTIPEVDNTVLFNISELSKLTDLYNELDRYVVMLSIKLGKLTQLSKQLEKRMILAKHSVSNSSTPEARKYANDHLVISRFIFNTFKQPIFSVALEVSKLQSQFSSLILGINKELTKDQKG